jgi:hypothetical protein
VLPSGRYWRRKYRYAGRERLLALGVDPTVSLAAARKARTSARELLAAGIDPGAHRAAQRSSTTQTFDAVAQEWLALQRPAFAPTTFEW